MPDDIVRKLGHLTLGTRFRRLGERLQAEVQRLARSEGIDTPVPFFPLLKAIRDAESLTVGELAEAIGVAQPGVTRSLAQMEKLRLVKSFRGKSDQRQRSIALTAKGDALIAVTMRDLWPRVDSAVAEICAGLKGSLLDQLSQLEAELDQVPLDRRAAKPSRGK